LLALGWTVTDTLDGWDHMEPPLGPPVLIRTDEEGFEGPRMTRLDLREGDEVIITAPDIDSEDIEAL